MSKEEISKETKNTLQNCWVMTTNNELNNENRKLKEAITEILDKTMTSTEKSEEWYFEYGTPEDNSYNYCPKCGAKIAKVIELEEEDE